MFLDTRPTLITIDHFAGLGASLPGHIHGAPFTNFNPNKV